MEIKTAAGTISGSTIKSFLPTRAEPTLEFGPEESERWLHRVTVSNPEYAARSTFTILEQVLGVLPLSPISRAMQDACPINLKLPGLHKRGGELRKAAERFALASGQECLTLAAGANSLGRTSTNCELLWCEFEGDVTSFDTVDAEQVRRFEERTGQSFKSGVGVMLSVLELTDENRAELLSEEGLTGIPETVDRHATLSVFTRFEGDSREHLRPSNYCVSVAWAGDRVYLLPREVRKTWAAPLVPLAMRNEKIERTEREWTLAAAIAAINGLNVYQSPAAAGASLPESQLGKYPLFESITKASPDFVRIVDACSAVRVDLSAWSEWTGHGVGHSSERLAWSGVGIPPEPEYGNLWLELPMSTDSEKLPGHFGGGRIGILVNNWARSQAATKLTGVRDQDGNPTGLDVLSRDRWYVCYLFGIDAAGVEYSVEKAVAFGYGGGFPVGINLDLANKGKKFAGLPAMSLDFVSTDPDGIDRKLPAAGMVANVVAAALSALGDPLATVEGDLSPGGVGLKFAWKGGERPNEFAPRPAQNWPDLRSEQCEKRKKGKPAPASLPVWNLQKHLNAVAGDAALYEWVWKYGAVYPLTADQQRDARNIKGLSVGEHGTISIGVGFDSAVARWKEKSVRDPFDAGWRERFAVLASSTPQSLLMWGAFFGDGPKTFRPSLKEFDALRHVDCKFPASMYRQPFDTLAIEFPATIGDAWDVHDAAHDCEARPIAMIIFKPHERPGLFVMILYSTGLERVICMPVGMDEDDPEIETHLQRMIPQVAGKGESIEVLRGVAELMRVGINTCFLLVQGGCRKIGFADPNAAAALRKQAEAKKARPEVKERARKALIAQPVVYGFHQTIKVYDEGSTYEPNAESAKAGYHVKPHWRRGCFVNQPYGEGRSLRKTIYRRPQFINHHLFGGMQAATNVTLVRVPAGDEGKLPEVTRI